MTSCPDAAAIQGLIEGSLAPDELGAIEHHVADCRDCRQLVAALGSSKQTAPTVTDKEPLPLTAGMPASIGRYKVVELVGAGGMGIVFAARDPELRRNVAIKLLRGGSGDDGIDARARLVREARAMAQLAHPNVVHVYEVGTWEGEVYVAMELVRGTTLRRWLSEPRFADEIIDAFLQAGRGLAAAHAQKLVHRDFKPDNVLVGDDGRIRVTDFGLARAGDDTGPDLLASGGKAAASLRLTSTGAVNGTPGYIAPEQYADQSYDARSDQFAFCVALWEGLGGTRPFTGDDAKAIEVAVLAGKITEPPEGKIPRATRKILERGLAIDPDQRWPSMDTLLTALRRARPRKVPLAARIAIGAVLVIGAALVAWRLLRAPAGDQPVEVLAVETEQIVGILMSGQRDVADVMATTLVDRYPAGSREHAAALATRGFVRWFNADYPRAEDDLTLAVTEAEAAHEDEIKARAVGQLVHTLEDQGKTADAKRWRGMVVATAKRSATNDAVIAGAIDAEARRLANSGDLMGGLARYDLAAEHWAASGQIAGWAINRSMVGSLLFGQNFIELGCALMNMALATFDASNVPIENDQTTMSAAFLVDNVAACEVGRNRPEIALPLAERAVAMTEERFGRTSMLLLTPLTNLGRAHALLHHDKAADDAFARALALPLPDHQRVQTLAMMAIAAIGSGNTASAAKYGEQVVAASELAFGKDHKQTRDYRVLFSKLLMKDKQLDRARPLVDELIVIYEREKDDPILLSDLHFARAKLETDPVRQRKLLIEVAAEFTKLGQVRADRLPEIEELLAKLPH